MKCKRPTPSTLEEWEHFPTINDEKAQMRLARAMGYPPSWRVVRNLIQVPIPEYLAKQYTKSGVKSITTNEDGVHMMTTVQDRIYAGEPTSQPDGYYNHAAALLASSKLPWRPEYDDVIHDNNDDDFDDDMYCSTSHRNKGGQLKGREAKFEEGDIVEVLYDEDEDEEPEWYEATIIKKIEYVDDIRYNIHYTVDDAMQPNVREDKIRATKKTKSIKKKKAAAAAAAPKAKKKAGGRKRAADSDLKTPSKPKKKRGRGGRPAGSKNKSKTPPVEETPQLDFTLDEGDPPWRTTGHDYIMREIQWTPEGGDEPSIGTIVAYIADTDVDSEGNPGFTCSKTGEPANLFHVVFDDFEQDFEQFEIEEFLVWE